MKFQVAPSTFQGRAMTISGGAKRQLKGKCVQLPTWIHLCQQGTPYDALLNTAVHLHLSTILLDAKSLNIYPTAKQCSLSSTPCGHKISPLFMGEAKAREAWTSGLLDTFLQDRAPESRWRLWSDHFARKMATLVPSAQVSRMLPVIEFLLTPLPVARNGALGWFAPRSLAG